MTAILVIVPGVRADELDKMVLAQNYDVVKQLSA